MMLQVFKSKIHRATVTQAELHYEGSITIDKALIKAANMVVGERVQIVNVNNGERLETYIIEGEENSGVICLNGPAARRVSGPPPAQLRPPPRGRGAGEANGRPLVLLCE